MNKKIKYVLILSVIFLSNAVSIYPAQAITLAAQLSGRILLQVESRGEAWYVNPSDQKKYYLGRPDDAYNLMRQLSLGISEQEFASWNHGAPAWAKGRLYIRPQSHGEAYYVDLNQRWHYLGRPLDAWLLFRAQGLGISNSNLAKIPSSASSVINTIGGSATPSDYVSSLSWIYKLENFKLNFPLKSSLNSAYAASVKTFYYSGDVEPKSAREQFYSIFFSKKPGDTVVKDLVSYGRDVAASRSWTKDQTAEFLISLVQYIPYDKAKLNQDPMQPNYPYETLYRDSGICSDKTFLTVAILRELGYGAAILDFPNLNHSAAGIECPLADSVNNSGYCYVETTNYFPVGVIPPSLAGGQAVISQDGLDKMFDASHLSQMQVFQKTTGLSYQGVTATKKLVADLQAKKAWIETQKPILSAKNTELTAKQATLSSQQAQLNAYQASGNISAYNNLVDTYNAGVVSYNAQLATYREELVVYNNTVAEYNNGLKTLYQQ
jgi:hypothetical protein